MSNEDLRRKIEAAEQEGWKVEDETIGKAMMVRREYGSLKMHLIILVLTCWSFGVGNLVYLAYCYFWKAEMLVLEAEEAA